MKEARLVRILLAVGAVSIFVIAVSNIFLVDALGGIVRGFGSEFVPYILCEQDGRGGYLLAGTTSYETCRRLTSFKDFINNDACKGFQFSYGQKDACLSLISIAQKRVDECLTLGIPWTYVDPNDVEMYCNIMNVTLAEEPLDERL